MRVEFCGGGERELSWGWGYCSAGPSLRGLDLCDPAVPPIHTTAQPSTFGVGIAPAAVGGSELRNCVQGSLCLDSLHCMFVVYFLRNQALG